MRHDQKSIVDWLIFAMLALGLVIFFMFINTRTVTGQAMGTAYRSGQDCYTFTSGPPVVVTADSIRLCPNATHSLAYFSIRVKQTMIDCQDSTIQGAGGALVVAQNVTTPRVTIRNCLMEGFDGLYSSQNPIDVYVEYRVLP